jgi:hypothetical protein
MSVLVLGRRRLVSRSRYLGDFSNNIDCPLIDVYTLQLPKNLAPSFKGKAMRFHYEISLSLNLNLPGIGLHGRQKQQEVVFPVKVVPTIDSTYLSDYV